MGLTSTQLRIMNEYCSYELQGEPPVSEEVWKTNEVLSKVKDDDDIINILVFIKTC